MYTILQTICTVAILTVVVGSSHAAGINAGADKGAQVASLQSRIIVKFTPDVHQALVASKSLGMNASGVARVDSLYAVFGVMRQRPLFEDFPAASQSPQLGPIYLLELPPSADILAAVAAYQRLGEVEYAEPDYPVELFGTTSDPRFSDQWYLHNTGQAYVGINRIPGDENDTQVLKTGKPDGDIDAQEAFDSQGEMTKPLIGIIDTGVDTDHEDLADNIWVNLGEDLNGNGLIESEEVNGVDDDHNGFIDDFHGWDFSGDTVVNTFYLTGDNDPTDNAAIVGGHGTHCAGIAGAVSNNGIGISGVVSPCRIIAIKVFPLAYHSVCARGIVYAADMNCDVISMSWGSAFNSLMIHDAIKYAAGRGVVPVAAAGNSGREGYFYPASLPEVFAVGASNSDDQVTSFSTFGDHIRLVAPGQDILSLRADSTDMYAYGGASGYEPGVHVVDDHYYLADGTSMASPCAAGVAAYLVAASPGLSPDRTMEILESSADDIIYPYGDSAIAYPGKDIYSGYGRINLNAAVQMLSGCLAKIDYPYYQAIVSGDVAVIGTASGTAFSDYRLEYGLGRNPTQWTEIAASASPVSKDTLGIWQTDGLGGLYSLRLTVGADNQTIMPVILDNVSSVSITSPRNGDTVMGEISIYGSTITSGFVRYTLDYRPCSQPSGWDTIITSTKIVGDDLLGSTVLNSYLAEDSNFVRLTVHTDAGADYVDSVMVHFRDPVGSGWQQSLSALGSLSVAYGDVTGDGYLDIITGKGYTSRPGDGGGLMVFSHDGQRQAGWPEFTGENMRSCPAVGDLDGDGIDDIVISSSVTGLRVFQSHGQDWVAPVNTALNDMGLATPVIADLEDDGQPEILMVIGGGGVCAWRHDGTPVRPGAGGWFANTRQGAGTFGWPGVTVADLDGDGPREIIVCSAEGVDNGPGGVYIFDIDGNAILGDEQLTDSFAFISGFAIANTDLLPDLEIIIAGAMDGRLGVEILKKDGSSIPGFPILLDNVRSGDWFGNSPAVGDIDGDGTLEIVITVWTIGEGRVYAWHEDGTPVGTINPPGDTTGPGPLQPVFARTEGPLGSPLLADINADGHVEILVRAGQIMGSGYERILAWDYQGAVIPGFPLFGPGYSSVTNHQPFVPAIGDLNLDDRLEMVLNTEDDASPGTVLWTLLESSSSSRLPWPSIYHDSWNSRILGFQPPRSTGNFPPYSLRVAASTDDRVVLAWVPRTPSSSRGYNLYRSQTAGEQGIRINVDIIAQPDSEYTDTDVTTGMAYYYCVANVDTVMQESPPSPQVEVRVGVPAPPTGLHAELSQTIMTLKWRHNRPEEDIERYNIYFKGAFNTDFYQRGSVTNDTIFVDSLPKPKGINAYRITAVNVNGESAPGVPAEFYIDRQIGPTSSLRIIDWADTNVTLGWDATMQEGVTCNLYRSMVSGRYYWPPIADSLSGDSISAPIFYTDTGLTRGETYYYVVAQVLDNVESPLSNEVSFVAGRPHVVPGLDVISRKDSITLHMTCADTLIAGYRVYRWERGGMIEVIDSLVQDTVYVDRSAVAGAGYLYRVAAVDTLNVESSPSPDKEGCLMVLDRGLLLVDMTHTLGLPGDSVTAFYQRFLSEYQLMLRKLGKASLDSLTLFDLCRHPVTIIHCESPGIVNPRERAAFCYPILKQYLDAGGALLVEGRYLFPASFSTADTLVAFSPGDFPYDYLAIDSAYLFSRVRSVMPFVGFTGASATPYAADYPPVLELDTVRTKAYGMSTYDDYQLGNIDYLFAHDGADVLYTYVASGDTALAHGMPVGIRRFTDQYKLFWFTFPFYYIEEDQAAQIVQTALDEFGIFTDVDDDPGQHAVPTIFSLHQNIPNPFNSGTTVRYALARGERVKLTVFNVLGQAVKVLVDGEQEAGTHEAVWDGRDAAGRDVATGIYFYHVEAGNFVATKKMLLLK